MSVIHESVHARNELHSFPGATDIYRDEGEAHAAQFMYQNLGSLQALDDAVSSHVGSLISPAEFGKLQKRWLSFWQQNNGIIGFTWVAFDESGTVRGSDVSSLKTHHGYYYSCSTWAENYNSRTRRFPACEFRCDSAGFSGKLRLHQAFE